MGSSRYRKGTVKRTAIMRYILLEDIHTSGWEFLLKLKILIIVSSCVYSRSHSGHKHTHTRLCPLSLTLTLTQTLTVFTRSIGHGAA